MRTRASWDHAKAAADSDGTVCECDAATRRPKRQAPANPKVDSPVKLDMRLIEADQMATPDLARHLAKANAADGIVFDAHGKRRHGRERNR